MRPDAALCPERFVEAFERYVNQGCQPGGFLRAVMCNNLVDAFHRADEDAMVMLPHIVAYMYNKLPGDAWGSDQRIDAFLARRRDELSKS